MLIVSHCISVMVLYLLMILREVYSCLSLPPHPWSSRSAARSYTRLNYHRNSFILFFILKPYTFVLLSINTAVLWLKYCPHNVKHHQSIHICTQYPKKCYCFFLFKWHIFDTYKLSLHTWSQNCKNRRYHK